MSEIATDIYEPAEDSYLLATASAREIDETDCVLDVGTGTGYVAASIHEETGASVFGVDINPIACLRAFETGVPTVRGNLVTPFCADAFDVIVCNPPYLPTTPQEARDDWLSVAVSGGISGRDVVEALFDDVGRVLRSDGRIYLLVSSLMDVDAVRERASTVGFASQEIARDDSFPFEVLAILKLERQS